MGPPGRTRGLSAASVAITVGALIAVLMFRGRANSLHTSGGLGGLHRFSGLAVVVAQLLSALPGAVAGLTALPTRFGARQPVAGVLASEAA